MIIHNAAAGGNQSHITTSGRVPVKPSRITRIERDDDALSISAERRSIRKTHNKTHDFLE